jgi:hypothetical protein
LFYPIIQFIVFFFWEQFIVYEKHSFSNLDGKKKKSVLDTTQDYNWSMVQEKSKLSKAILNDDGSFLIVPK